MKEILFRGKRVDNGEWVYGYYYESKISGCFILVPKIKARKKDVVVIGDSFDVFEVIPKTVGQYTGIKDDKWARVFEGDILEVSYDDGTAYTTEVKAYGNTLCVDVEGEDYDYTAFDFAVDLWRAEGCEFEVVDNIYDKNKDADASTEFLKAVDPFSVYHNF